MRFTPEHMALTREPGAVLCHLTALDLVSHLAHAECPSEGPHGMSECGLWRAPADASLTPAPHPGASPATTPEDDR